MNDDSKHPFNTVVLAALLAVYLVPPAASQPIQCGSLVEGRGAGPGRTADKPQSKCWHHDGKWWAALSTRGEFALYEFANGDWSKARVLNGGGPSFRADCFPMGGDAYILAFAAGRSEVHKLAYNGASYEPADGWDAPSSVPASGETATIAVDSLGVPWIATDESGKAVVYTSGDGGRTWLEPVVLREGIDGDDITVVTRLNGGQTGVMWSDQRRGEFGFAVHGDGDAPGEWTLESIRGDGPIADDHINAAVARDGTLYAAVKTEFDTGGMVQLGVYRRSPNGEWDGIYPVTVLSEEESGTRPIAVLNEERGEIYVFYTNWAVRPNTIGVKAAKIDTMRFSGKTVRAMESNTDLNDVSSTKQPVTSSSGLMILAAPAHGLSIDYCHIRDFEFITGHSDSPLWKPLR